MSTAGFMQRTWPDYARWTAALAFALSLHLAGALAMLADWNTSELMPNPPAITLDLAPVAAAPEIVNANVPVGPQQEETPPEVEQPPPPPPQQSETAVEPPKPAEKPREKKKVANLTSATPAERKSNVPVASTPGAGAINPNAVPNWKSLLVARLERGKRYPAEARSRHEQGVVQLAFSVDRAGGVHGARIVRSSGSAALDQETLALAQRVSPLPPPPAEIRGGSIPIVVPIRYNIR